MGADFSALAFLACSGSNDRNCTFCSTTPLLKLSSISSNHAIRGYLGLSTSIATTPAGIYIQSSIFDLQYSGTLIYQLWRSPSLFRQELSES